MPSFGKRMAALRKQKGLSQAELGRLLNMGQSTIAMYERDKRSPDYKSLRRIADFFGVSTDYLLGRTDWPYGTGQEGVPGNMFCDAKLYSVLTDPPFANLLMQIPDLTEEEKQFLVEHWECTLRLVAKKGQQKIEG